MEKKLIEKLNANIIRIRKANEYFRTGNAKGKATKELDKIITECNIIYTGLQNIGADVSILDLDLA